MTSIPRKAETILLADDEPYNLEWVIEYLRSKECSVTVAENVDQALEKLRRAQFRSVVVDLSLPILDTTISGNEPLFIRYPGLIIADFARNHGHLGRQVIVYSVHDDPLVRAFAEKIHCTYLLKGRPRQFKAELDDVLSYDPLAGT